MKTTIIIYGSTLGNTASAASAIAGKIHANIKDVNEATAEDLVEHENLILGSSTWGDGELQDDWYSFIDTLKNADLSGKTIALFGVGDQYNYSGTYANAMGELYNIIKGKAAKIIGFTSTEGYEFSNSEAVIDGQFVGLALDYDNQSDLSDTRIDRWISQISPEL